MKEINEYLYKVYNLIYLNQQSGLLERPRKFKIHKKDKKILNAIYNIYQVYSYKLTKKNFYNLVVDYSITNDKVIIQSGVDVAEIIQKIIKK